MPFFNHKFLCFSYDGVDGIKIEDVEAMGIEKYLSEIKSELMNGKYKPSPVKRVMIPKPDGSESKG